MTSRSSRKISGLIGTNAAQSTNGLAGRRTREERFRFGGLSDAASTDGQPALLAYTVLSLPCRGSLNRARAYDLTHRTPSMLECVA